MVIMYHCMFNVTIIKSHIHVCKGKSSFVHVHKYTFPGVYFRNKARIFVFVAV